MRNSSQPWRGDCGILHSLGPLGGGRTCLHHAVGRPMGGLRTFQPPLGPLGERGEESPSNDFGPPKRMGHRKELNSKQKEV